MRANEAEFRMAPMARVLGVSPSGYDAWCKRERSARAHSDEALSARVGAIHERSRANVRGAAAPRRAGRRGHAGEPQAGGSADA